jgi:8-oxo-dGTP pyrophosphatase MutT (NUDIX family)
VTFSALIARLEIELQNPLPGLAAQLRMAPRPRGGWPEGFDSAMVRDAAGLLLLFPEHDRPHLVLTVRSDRVRHSGQVSLPGGVVEPGETFEETALREAHEEIALARSSVRLLGRLTPIDIPVSGFRLHPIVASIDERPDLEPSDLEVARILEIPVDTLIDPPSFAWRRMVRGDLHMNVPTFLVQDVAIWGATAMVLAEFLTVAGWEGPEAMRS